MKTLKQLYDRIDMYQNLKEEYGEDYKGNSPPKELCDISKNFLTFVEKNKLMTPSSIWYNELDFDINEIVFSYNYNNQNYLEIIININNIQNNKINYDICLSEEKQIINDFILKDKKTEKIFLDNYYIFIKKIKEIIYKKNEKDKEKIKLLVTKLSKLNEQQWNYLLRECDTTFLKIYYYQLSKNIQKILNDMCSQRVIDNYKEKIHWENEEDNDIIINMEKVLENM